ncbi:hypothetical protein HZY91_02230 [Facklamia sp. DSM 111018]|uniref:DUF624 domain-containing protein n=1 Tax=Facklamia lactis TaxID=2749967 RepID=A0ABS0LNI4_9LACT|nr:DUF624 domain-containing protein [Facklamia lactis]MBG9979612.1 hypothetical protein [Facklamia lactis]MBG9985708.1 hypothetical protein [Facklamia lactis]
MNLMESKWQKAFAQIYLMVLSQLLWIVGCVLGLGVFGWLPASILVFKLWEEVKSVTDVIRFRPFHFFKQHYFILLKKYAIPSGLLSLSIGILFINIIYFGSYGGGLRLIGVVMSLLILRLLFQVSGLFAYLLTHFDGYSQRDYWQNAFAYSVARLGEVIVWDVVIFALFLLIWQWVPGLLVLVGMGFLFGAFHFFYTCLVEGKDFSRLRYYWRQQD